MNTYSFTFVIKDQMRCSDDMAEAIYEAGGDDANVGSRDGVVSVHFDRVSTSLDSAMRTALRDLAKAGYMVSHVDIDDQTLALLSA